MKTLDEVEKMVGVNLLKYGDATSNEVSCDLITNSEIHSEHKGRVERVYVYQSDFYRPEEYGTNENVYLGFSLLRRMLSDEAEEHTKLSYLEEMNVM